MWDKKDKSLRARLKHTVSEKEWQQNVQNDRKNIEKQTND